LAWNSAGGADDGAAASLGAPVGATDGAS
jgi:hypothetical protein